MPRLLLIDDDARLTSMVADYLRGHGFEVQVADTLGNGREHLAREAFDGLVLDLMLPDGDGLDLTRELRTQPRTRRLPLLMLTARDAVDHQAGVPPDQDAHAAVPAAREAATAFWAASSRDAATLGSGTSVESARCRARSIGSSRASESLRWTARR